MLACRFYWYDRKRRRLEDYTLQMCNVCMIAPSRVQHLLILPTHIDPLESTLSLLSKLLLLLLLIIHHINLRIHALHPLHLPRLRLLHLLPILNLCSFLSSGSNKTHNLPILVFVQIEWIEITFER